MRSSRCAAGGARAGGKRAQQVVHVCVRMGVRERWAQHVERRLSPLENMRDGTISGLSIRSSGNRFCLILGHSGIGFITFFRRND